MKSKNIFRRSCLQEEGVKVILSSRAARGWNSLDLPNLDRHVLQEVAVGVTLEQITGALEVRLKTSRYKGSFRACDPGQWSPRL